MALGNRVSLESTADELAEDSTVAPSDRGPSYTTKGTLTRCCWQSESDAVHPRESQFRFYPARTPTPRLDT